MPSRRFPFPLLFPVLLVSATGCFALFPLDDYQDGADAVDSGTTQPPSPAKDATADETSTSPEDDGGTPVKPEGRVVFVSSETFNGNLGGVAGADEKCQLLATNAQLEGTFRAIVTGSGSEETVGSRFGAGTDADKKGLVLVNIKSDALALNYGALLTDGPGAPILYTERGNTVFPQVPDGGNASCAPGAIVWTNTNSNGTADGNDNCNDWQNDGSGTQGRVGSALSKSQWLSACAISCNAKARLYCGQQ